jgi:steroid delta-isomerase-like uncharacterized protein
LGDFFLRDLDFGIRRRPPSPSPTALLTPNIPAALIVTIILVATPAGYDHEPRLEEAARAHQEIAAKAPYGNTNRSVTRPASGYKSRRRYTMNTVSISEAAKAVVRRNTDEVQGRGNFDVFEEIFADDFVDHTTQPGTSPDKTGVRKLYTYLREAFPDFRAEIHWQLADGDRVTTYKTYHGTHEGTYLGVAPTHRKIQFETVDVMRVQDGKITDHWGVANLLSLMQQIGGWTPPPLAAIER